MILVVSILFKQGFIAILIKRYKIQLDHGVSILFKQVFIAIPNDGSFTYGPNVAVSILFKQVFIAIRRS